MTSSAFASVTWAQSAELLWLLVAKELRVRYKSSFLGYLWALANPLAFTIVYYVAFQIIMRVQVENYGVYLVTGLFPWTWMAASLMQSAAAYRANGGLVRKVKIRLSILPLSNTVHEMVHFVLALPILIGAILVTGGSLRLSWGALIPVMVLVQLAMIYPLGLILAAVNVFVRDMEYVVGILLQMLFFLTPVVYPPDTVPQQYAQYLRWNPFSPMIQAWRAILYDGRLDARAMASCVGFALVSGALAAVVHRRLQSRVGELL